MRRGLKARRRLEGLDRKNREQGAAASKNNGKAGAEAPFSLAAGFRGLKAPAPSERQGQRQMQKQIPPLRCGMTNKWGKDKYRDSGFAAE